MDEKASIEWKTNFTLFSNSQLKQKQYVAHVIIDGAIDTEWIEELLPETYAKKKDDGILNPEDIAEVYWQLHLQKRSAWTQEMDLRPWMETF